MGHYKLAVIMGMALLMMTAQCDVNCKGIEGHTGQAGVPGRDGWPGAKGEKGEPAVMTPGSFDPSVLLKLKGDTGNRGAQGPPGQKGYRGTVGPVGSPGNPGPPGHGRISHSERPSQARSAFSVMRTVSSYPAFNQVVTYQTAVVNKPPDFNTATGYFTCRLPGVYYFSFQSVAKVSICLRIARDPPFNKIGFCDYNRNTDQVLTGGVVLQLTVGQKVWLESFKDQQKDSEAQDTQEKLIVFSGFLLFPDSE